MPGERIVGIRTPECIVIYPIHSPALVDYNDRPELWLDVRWDLEDAPNVLYSTQIVVTLLNEPGALGVIATTIGEYGSANIDTISSSASGADFRRFVIDLQVRDIQHPQCGPVAAARQERRQRRLSGQASSEADAADFGIRPT